MCQATRASLIVMPQAIQDFDPVYSFFKPLVVYTARCHYNSVTIRGREHLPIEGGYILAPCHQQALMEPLAILAVTRRPTVFLARADVFNNNAVRAFLTFLKILPVYRIRDGKESLSKNADIFRRSEQVLLDGKPLCLMAEGRHNNKHQLLPLVKGMFRIAGEAQRQMGNTPLYIVPVGIDFDEYEQPFANMVVDIGEPVAVQPFMEAYIENEPVALNRMREAVALAMHRQMYDIRSTHHYDDIHTLCNVLIPDALRCSHLRRTPWNRFLMRRRLANHFDVLELSGGQEAEQLFSDAREFRQQCQSLHVSEKTVAVPWPAWCTVLSVLVVLGVVAACVLMPWVRWIVLFCVLCFPWPLLPTALIPHRFVSDTQFRSSVDYGLRFFLGILYTIVIAIVAGCTGGFWLGQHVPDLGGLWWALIAFDLPLLLLPIEGKLFTWLRLTWQHLSLLMRRIFAPRATKKLFALRDRLLQAIPQDATL